MLKIYQCLFPGVCDCTMVVQERLHLFEGKTKHTVIWQIILKWLREKHLYCSCNFFIVSSLTIKNTLTCIHRHRITMINMISFEITQLYVEVLLGLESSLGKPMLSNLSRTDTFNGVYFPDNQGSLGTKIAFQMFCFVLYFPTFKNRIQYNWFCLLDN